MSQKVMRVNQLTRIALMGCIEVIVFGGFSDILYLGCITLTIVLFALAFDVKEAVLAAVVFGIMNMVVKQGVTIWSMMYLLIYPCYSLLVGFLKKWLLKHFWLCVVMTGVLSLLTGQLLQIPFLLVSKKVTLIYLVLGLKTSVIQGLLSALCCALLFHPLYRVLKKIERTNPYEKIN